MFEKGSKDVIETTPAWLITMRAISGTHEVAGSGDNPVILSWRDTIAKKYPEYAPYCRGYTHDSIAWCGLTVAYCMAANGIKPVKEFLWADNWRTFGTKLDTPRLGCVMTFKRTGGNHVALYERTEGQYYVIRGGNQSDAVNETRKLKSECTGMVWPAVMKDVGKSATPATVPTKPKNTTRNVTTSAGGFATVIAALQAHSVETAIVVVIIGIAVMLGIHFLWPKAKS